MLKPAKGFQADAYDGWIFDLDNTIYPAASRLFDQVSQRMTLFIQDRFNLDHDAAFARQKDLFRRYGTTASGLMHEHGIEPRDFMDFVHAIDLDGFHPDAELDAAIGALPGRKVIFTNGTHDHASRILGAMKLEHHFEGIYDIFDANHRPKPEPAIYHEVVERFGINASSAVMIEDMAVNLVPAAEMGVTTVLLEHNLDWNNPALTADHIDFIASDLKSFLRNMA